MPAPPVSGSTLGKAIRERFAASKIAPDHFRVQVRDGVAILEGRTDVAQHKGVATRLARLAGARKISNRIELTERARQRMRRRHPSRRKRPRRVRVHRR